MVDELRIARNYLLPPDDAFWQWQDDGEVITWLNGGTITFRPELAQVLSHLASNGLPPLDSVLLLLAASRDNWTHELSTKGLLGECWGVQQLSFFTSVLNGIAAGFDSVHRLEPEFRRSVDAKSLLAEVVFDEFPNRTTPEKAAAILQYMGRSLPEVISGGTVSSGAIRFEPNHSLKELNCFRIGLERVSSKRLKLRRDTGLDAIPEPADLELPPALRVRALLNELKQDDEFRGLAMLAQRLMAAVTMPRAVADRDELQLGGVSDITNRGPLDRLLLSELAQDDFALSVRVAMNEALYLRRESPPRNPQRQRTVLLDAGIRSWGVPRVFATAVALALAATADAQTEVLAFRAKQRWIEAVDLTSREGLIAHLSALEHDLHPGDALPAFAAVMADADVAAEAVIILTEDVLQDPMFLRLLAESALLSNVKATPLHTATVNRDGKFRLLTRTSNGSKLIGEARLELDALFDPPPKGAPSLVTKEWAADLPAIFSVDPFPLLLPHPIDATRMWRAEDHGVLALTSDRRLMLWQKPEQGARQLADDIPRGRIWWTSRQPWESQKKVIVGRADSGGFHLLQIDLEQLRCSVQALEVGRGVWQFCYHNGALFALFKDHIEIISAESGEAIQSLAIPYAMKHGNGRFLQMENGSEWFAVSYDGITAHLESVYGLERRRSARLLALFERDGVDGPIGITTQGDLYMTAKGTLLKVRHGLHGQVCVRDIAPDGRLVVLNSSSGTVTVDVATLQVHSNVRVVFGAADTSLLQGINSVNLRNRFTHICRTKNGRLALVSRKRQFLAIDYTYVPGADRFTLKNTPESSIEGCRAVFQQTVTRPDVGFRWNRAEWKDGSDAILDSRGLLHLRSSDRTIPEMTIVLAETELAGWISDGRWFGSRYFVGDRERVPNRQVFDLLKTFSSRLQ